MTCTANCIAHYAPLARPHPPEKWFERHICPLVSASPPAECWTLLGGLVCTCSAVLANTLDNTPGKTLQSAIFWAVLCSVAGTERGQDKTRTAVLDQNHIGQRFKSCCSCNSIMRGHQGHRATYCVRHWVSIWASMHVSVCFITYQCLRHYRSMCETLY